MDFLIVVPHPDDEVFGAGGTLFEYAQRGLQTGLITLTRGDQGKDLGLCTREQLAEVREQELRRAAEHLQIGRLEILHYPDKGIERHPEIVPLLVQRFEELQPRAVLTFPPNGVNRHVDHVATHRWVYQAVQQWGGDTQLYYYAPPEPLPEFAQDALLPTHWRTISEEAFVHKMQAMAQHKTQALSVLGFLERFPGRLRQETFHLAGYQGPAQSELI